MGRYWKERKGRENGNRGVKTRLGDGGEGKDGEEQEGPRALALSAHRLGRSGSAMHPMCKKPSPRPWLSKGAKWEEQKLQLPGTTRVSNRQDQSGSRCEEAPASLRSVDGGAAARNSAVVHASAFHQ